MRQRLTLPGSPGSPAWRLDPWWGPGEGARPSPHSAGSKTRFQSDDLPKPG